MNMAIMVIDIDVVISMLTLFVTCIPGIWFLLRFLEHRQRLRRQLSQGPETGLCHNVGYETSAFQSLIFIYTSFSHSFIFPYAAV